MASPPSSYIQVVTPPDSLPPVHTTASASENFQLPSSDAAPNVSATPPNSPCITRSELTLDLMAQSKGRAVRLLLDAKDWKGFPGLPINLAWVLQQAFKFLAEDNESLATLNEIGIYHKFEREAGDRDPFEEFEKNQCLPEGWFFQGTRPGLWCAPYSAKFTCHTHSDKEDFGKKNRDAAHAEWISHFGENEIIAQMTLSPNFFLYNPMVEAHQDLWDAWADDVMNLAKPNGLNYCWDIIFNSRGESMAQRMMKFVVPVPRHAAFYAEHGFGAFVGYTMDEVAIVIINPRTICTLTKALAP